MKKSGFTLIELLAVIVILAIIALITIPIITGVVQKARKGSVKDSVLNMFDAAGIYYAQHMTEPLIDNKITFTCNGEKCLTQNNGELIFKGQVPTSGSITIDKSGYTEAVYIVINKYCALGNRNNLDVQSNCSKLDITKPDLSISQGTVTSKSIMIGINTTDEESSIKQIKYEIDGNIYIDNFDDIEVNTTKTFNNLKANKEYRIKVTVTNGNDIKESKEINVTTKDLGLLTIKYNSNPTTNVNGYLKSQEAYLEYSGTDAVGYYIKSERRATSDKNAIKECGTDTMPGECSDITTTSLTDSKWYYFNSSPKLTYNETSTEVSNIYAIATNGISNTALSSGVISKIDVTAPNAPSIYMWDIAGNNKNSGDWSKDGVWTSARTTDVGSGIAYYQYSHDNVTFHNDISTLGWTYNYTDSNTKERLDYLINWSGQWTFYVRAVDKLGNVGQSSAAFIERVDNNAPNVSLTASSTIKTITVNVSATDSGIGLNNNSYAYSIDGGSFTGYQSGNSYTFTTYDVGVDSHTIIVRVRDALNNYKDTSIVASTKKNNTYFSNTSGLRMITAGNRNYYKNNSIGSLVGYANCYSSTSSAQYYFPILVSTSWEGVRYHTHDHTAPFDALTTVNYNGVTFYASSNAYWYQTFAGLQYAGVPLVYTSTATNTTSTDCVRNAAIQLLNRYYN